MDSLVKRSAVAFILWMLCSFGVVAADAPNSTARPSEWARPIEKAGVPNFFQVSPTLYRGAQPTTEGMKNLEKMGIKTVINLRSTHSDRSILEGTALKYVPIPCTTFHIETEDIQAFLKTVTDPERQPVFVHCQHGSDRTGTMVAIYRMVVQGWSKPNAIKEMTDGGFGFHSIWQNLISFLEELDLGPLKSFSKPLSPKP